MLQPCFIRVVYPWHHCCQVPEVTVRCWPSGSTGARGLPPCQRFSRRGTNDSSASKLPLAFVSKPNTCQHFDRPSIRSCMHFVEIHYSRLRPTDNIHYDGFRGRRRKRFKNKHVGALLTENCKRRYRWCNTTAPSVLLPQRATHTLATTRNTRYRRLPHCAPHERLPQRAAQ